MKPRPRCAENGIARELNKVFLPLGFSEIKRIPVLGREGPDLTINETGLVVDVKSRQQCPISYFSVDEMLLSNAGVCAVSILNLSRFSEIVEYKKITDSIMVRRWLDHMDEWRKTELPWGISTIILHRPRLPYGKSMVVFYLSDVGKISDLVSKRSNQ